jgi:transposase InsO family protein
LFFHRRLAYLSVIKDICSGEIVGWKVSNHINMELVLKTVERMKNNSNLPIESFNNIMIHSDQGFHYTNPQYIHVIKGLNMVQSMSRKGNCIDNAPMESFFGHYMVQSMSRKGNCIDNAPMESFFGHFKDDVDYKECRTYEELNLLIEEYIDYYNNARYQWDLKKMTPVQYRNHLLKIT